MASEERGAFFDEFVQGGLIDDADVTIKSARFVQWDYNGKVQQPVLALLVQLEDTDGNTHEQYLSSGELRFFTPSSDGRKAIPVGSQQKLNINTNAVAFLISLMNADTRGELAAKIRGGDDIGVIDGTKVHIVRKAQPRRAGIISQPGADGQQREKTQLQVEKLIAYPWESAPAGAATQTAARPATAATPVQAVAPVQAQAAAAGAPPAAAVAGNGTADAAYSVLMQILAESGGSIKKTMLPGKVFTNAEMKAAAVPVRNAVLGLIVNDGWLNGLTAQGMGVVYDPAAGTVSLG